MIDPFRGCPLTLLPLSPSDPISHHCRYRLFDTAELYNNEALLGKAIVKSDVAREEIFIISKLDDEVRCAFFDRNLHSRMPLVPTPARLMRACV
jgi:hypothetical protein